MIEIPFTPSEEARLSAVARQTGLDPAEWIKQLALDRLPPALANSDEEIDAKLRRLQEQDNTELMPVISTHALFAQWAEEDSRMTDEEREAEGRLWKEIEKGLAENGRRLQFRRLGE